MAVTAVDPVATAQEAFASVFATERTFDSWYERVLPRICGYVFARCGRDPDLAEDLTQQTFIEAVRGHERFDGRADPITWVCAIARHKLADHFRRLDAEERSQLRLVQSVERTATTAGELDVAEREAIALALATLPPMQRAVLVFADLDGLTCRQIGELVGRTEGAIESTLHRARASFRRAYGVTEDRDHA